MGEVTRDEFLTLEVRAREAEENMAQAAEYGRSLLQRTAQLEAGLEAERQEKHELWLKLEAKLGVERNLLEVLEENREYIQQLEPRFELADQLEAEVGTLRQRLSLRENKLKQSEDRVQLLEIQLEEVNRAALEASVSSAPEAGKAEETEEELAQLRSEAVLMLQAKQGLQAQLLAAQGERDEAQRLCQKLEAGTSSLEAKLEQQAAELSNYTRHLEQARLEVQELQVEMEALTVHEPADPNLKGNSLFSEVEDRRHLVESQLTTIRAKYEDMKVQLDYKNQQLNKVKMHNMALLNMAGHGPDDGERVQRLEDMLLAERRKVKLLTEQVEGDVESSELGPIKTEAADPGTASHTLGSEYNYLTKMLSDSRARNEELHKQLAQYLRQNLEEGDKAMEMSRKISNLEAMVNKFRAEAYQLKIKLDDAKSQRSSSGHSPKKVKPSKKIVERVIFQSIHQESQKASTTHVDNKENEPTPVFGSKKNRPPVPAHPGDEKPKKKTVSISASVECYAEAPPTELGPSASTKADLNTDESKSKLRKPATKKRVPNVVIDATEQSKQMEEQCKQQ